MALKVKWTPEAEDTFASIINYLEKEWSEKEIRKFAQKAQKNNPSDFSESKNI